MTDISNSELRRLDLTLLLVFLSLLRTRKATRTASELGLTQSGVSQALARLRDITGDPLFLRRPHGFEPTAAALALEPSVASAVEGLRAALGRGRQFVPGEATGVLTIAASDAEQAEMIPALIGRLLAEAPLLDLSVRPLNRASVAAALTAGEIDLAVGFLPDPPPALVAEPLYAQGYAVVGRPETLGSAPLTLRRYAGLPHVLVSQAGDLYGVADEALAAMGLTRRVVAAVPQFFPALATAAATGCIATVPERLARRHAPAFGLVLRPPPVPLRDIRISALRHRRNAGDARLDWLTGCFREGAPAT
jgi:DNA-binding transcriptional LysR family regulator